MSPACVAPHELKMIQHTELTMLEAPNSVSKGCLNKCFLRALNWNRRLMLLHRADHTGKHLYCALSTELNELIDIAFTPERRNAPWTAVPSNTKTVETMCTYTLPVLLTGTSLGEDFHVPGSKMELVHWLIGGAPRWHLIKGKILTSWCQTRSGAP